MDYATVTDASPAGWVVEGLTGFALNVASYVPAGFEAYARILHPAELHDAPVSWREVATANGRTADSGM